MKTSHLRCTLIGTAGLSLLSLTAIVGCSSKEKPPETAVAGASGADQGGKDIKGKDPNKGRISIGPKIAEMCALPATSFDFDSAALGPAAAGPLDALAECFISGPAKGKRMLLVGHADPRGEPEYNMGLGHKRAGTIGTYLQGKGLTEDRIDLSSRGELDATGTDEPSWALDRKVEILLAED
jgi:peptidoglycan-associated lipoprotein